MALKIMLTGGSGMVGRNILEHPRAKDWFILAPPSDDLNLLNWQQICDYIRSHRPDIVVHAAALVGGIQANIKNPIEYFDQNLIMGRNVVMAAYQSGVKRFINISSTCMYPRFAENPLREHAILSGELEPTNEGYALAKIMVTRLCQYIQNENSALAYKSLVVCNLYGRYDKFCESNSHLLAAIIHKIHLAKVNGDKTVDIWGDGLARREFMYAGDVADAILKAVGDLDTLPDVMNLATGNDFSVNEYYCRVSEALYWQGDYVHDLSKPVGMKQKLASIDAQKKWGWRPQTSLLDGIKKSYEFYLTNCLTQ
jgi:GDP-L-fucose synthase